MYNPGFNPNFNVASNNLTAQKYDFNQAAKSTSLKGTLQPSGVSYDFSAKQPQQPVVSSPKLKYNPNVSLFSNHATPFYTPPGKMPYYQQFVGAGSPLNGVQPLDTTGFNQNGEVAVTQANANATANNAKAKLSNMLAQYATKNNGGGNGGNIAEMFKKGDNNGTVENSSAQKAANVAGIASAVSDLFAGIMNAIPTKKNVETRYIA